MRLITYNLLVGGASIQPEFTLKFISQGMDIYNTPVSLASLSVIVLSAT